MSHTTAVNPGKGTLLKVSISAVLTTVALRVSIDGPGMSVNTADATHLDSNVVKHRPTLPDGGELSGSLFLDIQDATHKFLFGLIGTPVIATWQLVFNDADATELDFTGTLTELKPNGMEWNANLGADFKIKLNDIPTSTP